jgi:hypothetical protein
MKMRLYAFGAVWYALLDQLRSSTRENGQMDRLHVKSRRKSVLFLRNRRGKTPTEILLKTRKQSTRRKPVERRGEERKN